MQRHFTAQTVLFVALSLGLASIALRAGLREPRADRQEIPSPGNWVPFAAELLRQSPGRADGVAGKFYRDSDGSTREETWSITDPSSTVIEIRNIPATTYYVKMPDDRWRAHPMRLPARGWLPPQMARGTPGLSRLPTSFGEVEAYRFVGSVVEFRAPRLNFFPIIIENPVTGTRQEYRNITEGEQDARLFWPPAGVPVEAREEPMGIVAGEAVRSTGAGRDRPCCAGDIPKPKSP